MLLLQKKLQLFVVFTPTKKSVWKGDIQPPLVSSCVPLIFILRSTFCHQRPGEIRLMDITFCVLEEAKSTVKTFDFHLCLLMNSTCDTSRLWVKLDYCRCFVKVGGNLYLEK